MMSAGYCPSSGGSQYQRLMKPSNRRAAVRSASLSLAGYVGIETCVMPMTLRGTAARSARTALPCARFM
jgi:hypothetical protein